MTKVKQVFRWLKRKIHLRQYTYGWIVNTDGSRRCRARLNNMNNRIEFILWKAGEQGHNHNVWFVMGDGWESRFKDDSYYSNKLI